LAGTPLEATPEYVYRYAAEGGGRQLLEIE
jgi:hypothetical protein